MSVWVAKLPSSENAKHSNIVIENLVSMNSRADGLNVHGGVDGLTLRDSHIENSGDDCIGIWSTGIENMTIRNMTAANCAVTAGKQSNWGSCMGTYAFMSLAVEVSRLPASQRSGRRESTVSRHGVNSLRWIGLCAR